MSILKIDFLFQCFLFSVSIILVFVTKDIIRSAGLLYFILGGYQLLSHFVKYYNGHKTDDRKSYNEYLWIIIIVNIVWIVLHQFTPTRDRLFPVPLLLLFIMTVVGIVMALYHIKISYMEQKDHNHIT